jgi:hypothetical protein
VEKARADAAAIQQVGYDYRVHIQGVLAKVEEAVSLCKVVRLQTARYASLTKVISHKHGS